MTRVELSKLARLQLHRIASSRLQPESVFVAVERGLGQLARQPLSGQAVGGRFTGTRVLVVGFLDVRAPEVPEP